MILSLNDKSSSPLDLEMISEKAKHFALSMICAFAVGVLDIWFPNFALFQHLLQTNDEQLIDCEPRARKTKKTHSSLLPIIFIELCGYFVCFFAFTN